MQHIILGSGVLSIFLGVLALTSGKKTREVISFGVFCLITSIWIFSNILSLAFAMQYAVFLKLTYAFGALTVAALLAWSFFYNDRIHAKAVFVAAYVVGGMMAIFSLIDGFIVGEIHSVTIQGISVEEGPFFGVFSAYLFLTIVWSLINVAILYRRFTGVKKSQAKIVLIGIAGFMLTTLLVSGILPAFGIFSYTNLDSPSSIIFVLFAMVAIVKHRFLGTKVILAQVLVSILVTTSLIQFFNSRELVEYGTNVVALLTVFIVGIILVRSVMDEVRRKEELQTMAKRLSAANDELRRLDVAKSEFISIASHQLRTPLSAIKGYVSLMLEGYYGRANNVLQEMLNKVYLVNNRLMELVEDLLSVSRIESGKVQYYFKPTRLEPLLADMVDMFAVIAKNRSIMLKIHLLKKGLPEIMMDAPKIQEVITNLLSNALKYTPEGGKVMVSVEKTELGARIIVSDTGIGIKKEYFPRLFEKFIRSEETTSIDVSGTGLGLYVSKKFVEAHGGNIWAESEGAGKGATFIVELPFVHSKAKGH
ncbi:MAG: hypothetical protein HYV45_00050 [Candidatus Moranbacteria bacterium]|nr:hypothetical protein [Candidatus Moranbacteria bacterium]